MERFSVDDDLLLFSGWAICVFDTDGGLLEFVIGYLVMVNWLVVHLSELIEVPLEPFRIRYQLIN